MNNGYFFALDIEKSSSQEDNLTVYNYVDLPAYLGNPCEGAPKYPVSVIITGESVKFVLHYTVYKYEHTVGKLTICPHLVKNCKLSDSRNVRSQNNLPLSYFHHTLPKDSASHWGKNNIKIFHMEEVLFELPFVGKSNNLTSIVKKLYCTEFPIIPSNTINYMAYLLKARYDEKYSYVAEDRERLSVECKKGRALDRSRICYSSLTVWGMKNSDELYDLYSTNNDNLNQKTCESPQWKSYDKFLRKLLLDFLFDVKYSDIFQNSGNYAVMQEGLEADFFVSAILKKSEFFYQRELINDRYIKLRTDDAIESNTAKPNYSSHQIYAEYFDKAESAWVECIQDRRAEEHFRFIPDWYENDIANEDSNSDKIKQANFPKFRILPNSWFAEPEEEMQRVVFELEQINEKADETISNDNESICNSFIFAKKLGCLDQLDELKVREKKISQWMFRRYDFTDAFRLAYSSCLPNLSVFANLAIVATLIVISVLFIVFPSFIIGLFEDFSGTVVKFKGLSIALACFFIIPMYLIGAPILSLLKGILHKKIVFPHLHLFFPRLVASIAAAWLTVTFSEDLFKAFFDHHWNCHTLFLMGVVITAFVHYEVDKIIPHSTWWTKIMRSLELVLFSFVISLFVGVFAINFTGEKLLERCGVLEEVLVENQETNHINVESINHFDAYSEQSIKDATSSDISSALVDMRLHENIGATSPADVHHHPIASQLKIGNHYIFILWDFLIQFAFVAMFIGIFIQMIFEEKNITES